MKTRLLNVWEALSTSLWFVPTIMATAAIVMSFVSVGWDAKVNAKLARSLSWLWSGGPDGARSLLSTIAGSMMTVTGVVFSITMVTLTLASSQFGSRLLRNFMRDRGNQIVLGTFISTFVYCLLVLRTVRSTAEGSFVPYISVTLGVVMALASLGVLIFFIHHVAGSIQAESLTAEVGTEFRKAVDKLCTNAANGAEVEEPRVDDVPLLVMRAEESGYVLSVDRDALVEEAAAAGLRVWLVCQPGDFVLRGGALAQVWAELAGADARRTGSADGQRKTLEDEGKAGDAETPTKLRRAFQPGRTPDTDPGRALFRPAVGRHRRARSVAGHQRSLHRHRLHGLAGRGAVRVGAPTGARALPPGRDREGSDVGGAGRLQRADGALLRADPQLRQGQRAGDRAPAQGARRSGADRAARRRPGGAPSLGQKDLQGKQ